MDEYAATSFFSDAVTHLVQNLNEFHDQLRNDDAIHL